MAARGRASRITGVRITTLIVVWLGGVYLAAPRLGLYYGTLAVWYTLPSLILVYSYCLSHRRRSTALLAVVATVIVVVVVGFAYAMPKATAA